MSIIFTIFASNLNKTHKIMKKLLVIITLFISTIAALGTPYEAMNNISIISKRLNDSIYVGSKTYKYLVGGLYKKDDILGTVFYVDEKKNTMYILCLTWHKMLRDDDPTVYSLIKKRYAEKGWKLLPENVCNLLIANTPTIIYNRTWTDNDEHRMSWSDFIILDSDHLKFEALFYCTHFGLIQKGWKKVYIEQPDGSKILVEQEDFIDHIGWREVPLDTRYVSEMIGK